MSTNLDWLLEDLNADEIIFPQQGMNDLVSVGWYEHGGGFSDSCNCHYDDHSNYSDYSDYNPCAYTCQVCNTGQRRCDVNQYCSGWIGSFSYTNDARTLAKQHNEIVNYINSAVNYINTQRNKYGISGGAVSTVNATVSVGGVMSASSFNAVNNGINQFINGTTSIANKSAGNSILSANLSTFRTKMSQIQIPTTLPCCQKGGTYEKCASRQR